MSSTAEPESRFEWPTDPGHRAQVMPAQAASGSSVNEYVRGEAVIDVPDDAVEITADVTVADGAVAVTPDGTVVDAGADGTIITTADGVRVRIDSADVLTIDADFTNGPETNDLSTLGLGASLETSSGTVVTRQQDGNVTVIQPNGQTLTMNPDGTVDVELPVSYDSLEGGTESDGAGVAAAGAVDSEGAEGAEDADGLVHNPVDTDGDGVPDYRDLDSDGDGIPDSVEARPDDTDPTSAPGEGGGTAVAPDATSDSPSPAGGGGAPTDGGGGGAPTDGGGGGAPTGGGGGAPTGGGGGGAPTGGGGDSTTGGEDPQPPGGPGSDFTADLSDLRDDAAYFDDLVGPAETLAACWEAAGPLVQHWGLWALGAPAYMEGAAKFATLYKEAAVEMVAIADGLRENADGYEQQEASGVAIAGTINE